MHTKTININMNNGVYSIPSLGALILHDEGLRQHSSHARYEYE
jgi:hypothetical protein